MQMSTYDVSLVLEGPTNIADVGCKIYRSILSLIYTLKGNMLITAMLERLLAIQFPVKFGKLPPRHAWYFVVSTGVTAVLMIIPIIIQSDWATYFNRIVCYTRPTSLFLAFYYGLFSGACFVQTAINGVLNAVLLLKIYVWLRYRRRIATSTQTMKSNELGACVVLLIISSTTFLLSIPGTTVTFFAVSSSLSIDLNGASTKLRLLLNLREIFLIVIYMRSIFNTIIYIWRMEQLRVLFLCIVQCKQFSRFKRSHKPSSNGVQQ
uniref:G-protein coupled receptors family 1 profile domain-containing protein n=1 Tax=Trichobilharzia regenti TaxID=157069 RepID=A0AA85JCY0_TRIRE|nr:unnamed protein product [Trichobilharzia regenti]